MRFILFISILMYSCSSEDTGFIVGTWKVEEMWKDGVKTTTDQYIEFTGTGKYTVHSDNEIHGYWKLNNDQLILYQPEIKDLHGNRQIEPFRQNWYMQVVKPYLILQGTAESSTQSMKLVLKKQDES